MIAGQSFAPRRNRMRKKVIPALVAAAALLVAPTASALPNGTEVQIYQGNLSDPIDMAWVEGTNKIFFTEKNTGRVRVMKGRNLLDRSCVDLPVSNSGEQGALGI